MQKCQRSFQPHEKMGKFLPLPTNVSPKSDKKFLEQFSLYMLCCFKNYASNLVVRKVVAKIENVQVK